MLGVTFLRLLNDDLHTTFLAEYNGNRCVVKFFTEKSDANNRYSALVYLRTHSAHPEWYPKPWFQTRSWQEEMSIVTQDGKKHTLADVYQIDCYEYLAGGGGEGITKTDSFVTNFEVTDG